MWNQYELELIAPDCLSEVLRSLVNSFVKTPQFLEVKIFFLLRVIDEFTYEHVDKILCSIEQRFGEMEEDGSNSFLLCNLNPIKSAMHLLLLLSLIEKRYSMAVLRTENLAEIILRQA